MSGIGEARQLDRSLAQPAAEPDASAHPALGRFIWLPFLFGGVVAAATALNLATPVRYLYPLAASAISFFLYLRAPATYTKFVWWLWFLSPFVRRIVDFRGGWVEPNQILAAPLLATLACLPCLFRDRSLWRRPVSLPFALAFLCVGYGFCVGVLFLPLSTLLVAAMNWLAPLTFGFYLYSEFTNSEHAPAQAQALLQSFTGGLLLMGAYGVAQFIFAPGWDVMWLIETASNAFGLPEPFGIRVFSTMSSPFPFALALAVGLLLLMKQKQTVLVLLAGAAGYASLLLTSVRAVWAGWAIGVALLSTRKTKNAGRLLFATLLIVACIAAAVTTIEPLREVAAARLSTFTDIRQDESFQSRTLGYHQVFRYLSEIPFGMGLGSMEAKFTGKLATGPQIVTDIGARDSAILEILFSLGWIAGPVYLFSLLALAFFLLRRSAGQSAWVTTTSCISLAMMTQLFLGSAMVNLPGVLLWGFAGISLGAKAMPLPASETTEPARGAFPQLADQRMLNASQ